MTKPRKNTLDEEQIAAGIVAGLLIGVVLGIILGLLWHQYYKVTWDWEVNHGEVTTSVRGGTQRAGDQIVVTNTSRFAITDVKMTLFQRQRLFNWPPFGRNEIAILRVQRIASQQRARVNIPRRLPQHQDRLRLELNADEQRTWFGRAFVGSLIFGALGALIGGAGSFLVQQDAMNAVSETLRRMKAGLGKTCPHCEAYFSYNIENGTCAHCGYRRPDDQDSGKDSDGQRHQQQTSGGDTHEALSQTPSVAVVGLEGAGKTVLTSVLAKRVSEGDHDVFLSPQNARTLKYVEKVWNTLQRGEWPPSTPPGEMFELRWTLKTDAPTEGGGPDEQGRLVPCPNCSQRLRVPRLDDTLDVRCPRCQARYPLPPLPSVPLQRLECELRLIDTAGQDLRQLFDDDRVESVSELPETLQRLAEYCRTATVLLFLINLSDFLDEADAKKAERRVANEAAMKAAMDYLARHGEGRHICLIFTQADLYKGILNEHGNWLEVAAAHLPYVFNAHLRQGEIAVHAVSAVSDTQVVVDEGTKGQRMPKPGFHSQGLEHLIDLMVTQVQDAVAKTSSR